MVYECDNCEAALAPGATVCPRCGQVFDEPVPADALLEWEAAPPEAAPAEVAPEVVAPEVAAPEVAAPPRRQISQRSQQTSRRSHRWPEAATFLLAGLCWFGYRHWNAPVVPKSIPAPVLQTDLAAHPDYMAHMTALVQTLRASGVEAEWPAFGSDDMLLVTPQVRIAEPPARWDADMNRRLAQGVYGHFAQTRFESGFCDTDTTACFVLVTNASGQVVAVDFMGDLE